MKPFVLKQHDKDSAALQVLRDEEIAAVGGAYYTANNPKDANTITVTAGSGTRDDGVDDW